MSEAPTPNGAFHPSEFTENATEAGPRKMNTGISILSGLELIYGSAVILFYLYFTISNGFKALNLHILFIGMVFIVLAIGLFKRAFWAWLINVILSSGYALSAFFSIIKINNPKAIPAVLIWSLFLIVLIKLRKQIISKKSR